MLKENNIQKNVLEKIRSGGVSMHSKIYFVLRSIFIGIASVFALICSIFALGLVFFSIHESGERFLLDFGEHGLTTLVTIFPWAYIFSFMVFTIALSMLLYKFTSAYKFPIIRILLLVLAIVITGSTFIEFTPINAFLLQEAEADHLPIIGWLYEQVHDSHVDHGVYRGDITYIAKKYFVISHNDNDRDSDEGIWSIIPPNGFNMNSLSIGGKAYVAGKIMNGIVYAYGIHIISDEE